VKYFITTILFFCCALLLSCEKEVNINLSSGEPKLVVEGRIETDSYPFVMLTRSVGYFSKIDLTTLENTFVHNAIITVSDGSKTIQLKEYSIDTGLVGTKFSFYSIDTGDAVSFNFKGRAEAYYTLKIEAEGKTYNSITKIPAAGGIDSLWFRKPSENMAVPTAVMMYVRYSDPDTLGNYVRYFTKRNSEMFLVPFNSTFDDQIVNGTTIDSLSLVAGYNRSQDQPNFDSVGYFFRGDTVTLKWCSIDKSSFKFFSTLEFATGSVGNPFSSPVNVTSNIQGGALGVWAGYGVQLTTRIISK
jgi:hypothetical protein